MKYMRRTAGYYWIDHKSNLEITEELKITSISEKKNNTKPSGCQ